ncbi:MAG TPA: hypothetical protein ENN76_02245 [Euryarchaeota archaeon]|nr:hypothetical protein [Euryarchaeota archaeon]
MDDTELPTMAPVEEEKRAETPKDPHFPYTLIILAGVMTIFNGILLLSMDFQHVDIIQFEGGSVERTLEILSVIAPLEIFLGVLIVVLGVVARLKVPVLGYAGGAVAIVALGPLLLGTVLGIISIVLLSRYSKLSTITVKSEETL